MAETALTVDLTQLRDAAGQADRVADAIAAVRVLGCDTELAGSAVAAVASPALVAARLDEVLSMMTVWAAAVRNSAAAFAASERDSTARIAGS